MTSLEQITVRVLKYDGSEHRRWQARVSRHEGSLIVLDAQFDEEVQHDLLGSISRGTRTIEYYWLDRWFNVFQFLEKSGQTKLFYCNVNQPPQLSGDTLTYVDLDIDVLVQPDFSYQILDLEEFAENAVRYGYPEEIKTGALTAVDELISAVAARHFPFA